MSTFDHMISNLPCHDALINDQISNVPTHASFFRQKNNVFDNMNSFSIKCIAVLSENNYANCASRPKLIWFYNKAIEV